MKKYFLIYKVTNLVNQKFYIGKHETVDVNDGYLGSGRAIVSAIKKHGRANFSKEILHVFDNKESMESAERRLVTERLISDPLCYNLALGGQGGNIGPIVNEKIGRAMSACLKGKPKSEAHKAALRKSHTGRKISQELKERISKSVSKKWRSLTTEERKSKFGHAGNTNGFYGKVHSATTVEKIKTSIGDSRKGAKNPNAKPITLFGVTHSTRKECMQALNISKQQLYKILGV